MSPIWTTQIAKVENNDTDLVRSHIQCPQFSLQQNVSHVFSMNSWSNLTPNAMAVLESAHHEDSETPPTYVIRVRRQGSISKEKVIEEKSIFEMLSIVFNIFKFIQKIWETSFCKLICGYCIRLLCFQDLSCFCPNIQQ